MMFERTVTLNGEKVSARVHVRADALAPVAERACLSRKGRGRILGGAVLVLRGYRGSKPSSVKYLRHQREPGELIERALIYGAPYLIVVRPARLEGLIAKAAATGSATGTYAAVRVEIPSKQKTP